MLGHFIHLGLTDPWSNIQDSHVRPGRDHSYLHLDAPLPECHNFLWVHYWFCDRFDFSVQLPESPDKHFRFFPFRDSSLSDDYQHANLLPSFCCCWYILSKLHPWLPDCCRFSNQQLYHDQRHHGLWICNSNDLIDRRQLLTLWVLLFKLISPPVSLAEFHTSRHLTYSKCWCEHSYWRYLQHPAKRQAPKPREHSDPATFVNHSQLCHHLPYPILKHQQLIWNLSV